MKVDHLFPMRSLDKATSSEELNHFVNVTTSGALQFLSQPKLDGSALSLEYRMGRLVRAATRGSGERGRTSPEMPVKLPTFLTPSGSRGRSRPRGSRDAFGRV